MFFPASQMQGDPMPGEIKKENNVLKNLLQKKQFILDAIKKKGPCLPSSVSHTIGLSLLLTSALLSEMRAEKTIKVSHLKIGSSPLYYVSGQETMIENFIKHLPQKERETFELLKRKEILDSEKLEPGHRVALSNLKDFAVSLNVKVGETDKIFWRFHTIKTEEAFKKIKEILAKKIEKPKIEKEKKPEKEKIRKRKGKKEKEEFKAKVYDWLRSKGLDIVKKIDEKDVFCTISTKTAFGNLNFLVIIKQKKRISETDLSLAYHKGQQAKLPVLLLTTGQLSKKASAYLEKLGKLVIVNSI